MAGSDLETMAADIEAASVGTDDHYYSAELAGASGEIIPTLAGMSREERSGLVPLLESRGKTHPRVVDHLRTFIDAIDPQ